MRKLREVIRLRVAWPVASRGGRSRRAAGSRWVPWVATWGAGAGSPATCAATSNTSPRLPV